VIQRRFGTLPGIVGALLGFAAILAAMAIGTDNKAVLVVGVVISGAFLGINNTLITETVMKIAPVERGVASAAYSFVRFSGGAIAPWLAGTLGEKSVHLPFWVGSVAVVLAVLVLLTARHLIAALDAEPDHGAEPVGSRIEAEAVTVGDS
jgi:MFS transporter, ACDE family, multidrug resistance protein